LTAVLPGHAADADERLDQLLRLREVQDETGVLAAVVLAGPDRDEPADRPADQSAGESPAGSLRTFAVARLLLDNVPHLACDLAGHGPSLAQLAFNFGVDALAGVPEGTGPEELTTLIWDAGFQPVERDEDYRVVREYEPPAPLARRRSEPQRVWA
ncbi:aminofutalosine synthase MqnE, partial [Micromonospora zhanjiangensis]